MPADRASAVLVYQQGTRVVAAANDGSHPRVVTHGFDPVVSPDGRRVAFFRSRSTEQQKLLVTLIRGGKPRPLDADSVFPSDRPVSWSRDGKSLTVGAATVFHDRMLVVQVPRLAKRRVELDGQYAETSFSPDGQAVAVAAQPIRGPGILSLFSSPHRGLRRFASGSSIAWGARGIASVHGHDVQFRERPRARPRVLLHEPDRPLTVVDWSATGKSLLVSEASSSQPEPSTYLLAGIVDTFGQSQFLEPHFDAVAGLSHDGERILGVIDGNVVDSERNGNVHLLASHASHPSWTR